VKKVVNVQIKLLNKDARVPSYAYAGDAGMDLYAAHDAVIKKHDRVLVKTGIAIALPAGYEAQIRPRSGLALKHGLTVLNTPGTIDSGYRGEIGVILANVSKEDYFVEKHTRVAQMVIKKVEKVSVKVVKVLSDTDRGAGGYGSSGR
jgi:dUTP pyrophosphatase